MSFVSRMQPHEFSGSKGKAPLLGQIDIELTERCNNNCLHCCINLPEDDAAAKVREMDTEFVKELLRQAADLGFLTVRFTGGEPTLRPDFAEIYLHARRLGMQVFLYTNARGITEELAALLSKYPPGGLVEVSVYGMNAGSYDRVARCSGAFEEFRRGVELLSVHKIPFIVKSPKLPFLKDEQKAFEEWASTIPAMDGLPGYSMNFEFRGRRDSPEKNNAIAQLRATPGETVAMFARQPGLFNEMAQFCSKFIGPQGDKLFGCGAGHEVCIDAYGFVQACLPLRHPDFGIDLHGTALKEALEERFPAILEARATNPEYLRRCANCFLKGLCEQCPAKSWAEHGTLDTPVEYLCDIAHAQARYLGLLEDDEHGWEVPDWKDRVARFAEINRKTNS
jgi:radical SAM protein with 4Fe4S-binding SPASM domain